jgi:hypothetical protein
MADIFCYIKQESKGDQQPEPLPFLTDEGKRSACVSSPFHGCAATARASGTRREAAQGTSAAAPQDNGAPGAPCAAWSAAP